jgi:hypothetical protein
LISIGALPTSILTVISTLASLHQLTLQQAGIGLQLVVSLDGSRSAELTVSMGYHIRLAFLALF